VVLAAALLISLAAVSVAAILTSESGLRSRVKRRALVSCKDGQTFSGVLWSTDRGCLVLKQTSLIGNDAAAAVDGEVLILRADVAFIQFP
jgi:hypothetical protein